MMTIKHSKGTYPINFKKFENDDGYVITDENIKRTYPTLKVDQVLPPGESTKNFEHLELIQSNLAKNGATRKSTIVALGGGVIGDLVGFAAATYMRGIDYIQVPTTLLAMVDSSVGGKVAIDLNEGKNLVGAFHPPAKVIIDTDFLKSLPDRQIACGMAEVLKYGLILDQNLWENVDSMPQIDVIKRCIELKKQVVEEDEFETKGIRAKLNFGHTIGHAIEKLTNYETYTHGEAISIGMVLEAKLSEKLGIAEKGMSKEIEAKLNQHNLPTKAPFVHSAVELVQSMKIDKKSERGELTMSLLKNIGECELIKSIPEPIVLEILKEMNL